MNMSLQYTVLTTDAYGVPLANGIFINRTAAGAEAEQLARRTYKLTEHYEETGEDFDDVDDDTIVDSDWESYWTIDGTTYHVIRLVTSEPGTGDTRSKEA